MLLSDKGAVILSPKKIPPILGKPRQDQLQGTFLERLAEMAGRICYDSLGEGRSSQEYHKHILEVGHLSVYEHCVFTIEMEPHNPAGYLNMNNVWVRFTDTPSMRVTLNIRHVLELDKYPMLQPHIKNMLRLVAAGVTPTLFPDLVVDASDVRPETDEEIWAPMLMVGSRGFSHELVRHGDWTAISQRSTRYVDESLSSYVVHPLIEQAAAGLRLPSVQSASELVDKHTYKTVVEALESNLISKGVSKQTARKQARGAARGYLGNALQTQVAFSASLAQWKHMIRMRCSEHADAEIRVIMVEALKELKEIYPSRFEKFSLKPAPDGLGEVAYELE